MSTETITQTGGGMDSFAALFEASLQGGDFGKDATTSSSTSAARARA
jgi:hypothetical protein